MNHLTPLSTFIAGRSEKAFNQFYHAYHPVLFSRIRCIIRHTTDAEDITQEAFIQLWLQGAALKEIQNPLAWLNRVAINLSLNHLRKQQGLKNLKKISGRLHHDSVAGDQDLGFKQLQILVQEGVRQLPGDSQQIIRLHLERGWGPKLIAGELNLSVSTVKNKLEYSRRLLREYLKNYAGVWLPWVLIVAAACS